MSSNLPAPLDPNLLPAYRQGLGAAYSQDIFLAHLGLEAECSPDFLAAIPLDHPLELGLKQGALQARTEGGTLLGQLRGEGLGIMLRLLEAGKHLLGKYGPAGEVSIWLVEI